MGEVTLQLVEGLERGQVYEQLSTPITVGREEDNDIQLNDERISRFHAKIQEDGGRVILTDLGSTNGTRVNGHPVQIRVLRPGDQVGIGRCLLIFGSAEEISNRAADLQRQRSLSMPDSADSHVADSNLNSGEIKSTVNECDNESMDPDRMWPLEESATSRGDDEPGSSLFDELELFPDGPPDMIAGLSPLHQAQLSDYLAYVHDQIRIILEAACEESAADESAMSKMKVDWDSWQRLLKVEMDIAKYLRRLADPDA